MKQRRTYGAALAAGIGAGALTLAAGVGPATAQDGFGHAGLASAQPRSGVQADLLAPGLTQRAVAKGAQPLTNPDPTLGNTHYGYNTSNGGPLTQDPKEAFKTEPDKNVYLVLRGHHYLYQGHEGGPSGSVTRVDLDNGTVSLVTDKDTAGQKLPVFDGITWDPFTHQLLVTVESKAPTGGVFAIGLDDSGNPSGPAQRLAALGSGGYEGIQNDAEGNVWIVEDIGGAAAGTGGTGKVPNSYVYRFRPADRRNLTKGGILQALQVLRTDGTPVTASQLQANARDPFISTLHTYGTRFATRWVTVGTEDSTASAKAAGATPFKRPENGVFRPGSGFREFYFTETGDTNATSDLPGAFGGVFRLTQSSCGADSGWVSAVTLGDVAHTGFDNISFASKDDLLVVEDAGDSLHAQRNALDSGYLLNLRGPKTARTPLRWLAEGRDPSATYDATTSPGYNDGDNEITGIHTSDGDPTPAGILGNKLPRPLTHGWRIFWTQQHGDNTTWELHRA